MSISKELKLMAQDAGTGALQEATRNGGIVTTSLGIMTIMVMGSRAPIEASIGTILAILAIRTLQAANKEPKMRDIVLKATVTTAAIAVLAAKVAGLEKGFAIGIGGMGSILMDSGRSIRSLMGTIYARNTLEGEVSRRETGETTALKARRTHDAEVDRKAVPSACAFNVFGLVLVTAGGYIGEMLKGEAESAFLWKVAGAVGASAIALGAVTGAITESVRGIFGRRDGRFIR